MVQTSFVLLTFIAVVLDYIYCYDCEQLGKKQCERVQHLIGKICHSKADVQEIEDDCIGLPYKKTIKCINVHCSNTNKGDPIKNRSAVMSNVSVTNKTIPQINRASQECEDCKSHFDYADVEISCKAQCSCATVIASSLFIYMVLVLRMYFFWKLEKKNCDRKEKLN